MDIRQLKPQAQPLDTIRLLTFGALRLLPTQISGSRIGNATVYCALLLIVTSTRRFERSRSISASNSACDAVGATERGGTTNFVDPRPRASICEGLIPRASTRYCFILLARRWLRSRLYSYVPIESV